MLILLTKDKQLHYNMRPMYGIFGSIAVRGITPNLQGRAIPTRSVHEQVEPFFLPGA